MALVEASPAEVTPPRLSARFGWVERDCHTLVDRLVTLGLLGRDGSGGVRFTDGTTIGDGANQALTRSALVRAQAALDGDGQVPPDVCRTSALAVTNGRLDQVHALIAALHEDIRALASPEGADGAVVLVSTQCLRLDR